jgi:hypothetical protein
MVLDEGNGKFQELSPAILGVENIRIVVDTRTLGSNTHLR